MAHVTTAAFMLLGTGLRAEISPPVATAVVEFTKYDHAGFEDYSIAAGACANLANPFWRNLSSTSPNVTADCFFYGDDVCSDPPVTDLIWTAYFFPSGDMLVKIEQAGSFRCTPYLESFEVPTTTTVAFMPPAALHAPTTAAHAEKSASSPLSESGPDSFTGRQDNSCLTGDGSNLNAEHDYPVSHMVRQSWPGIVLPRPGSLNAKSDDQPASGERVKRQTTTHDGDEVSKEAVALRTPDCPMQIILHSPILTCYTLDTLPKEVPKDAVKICHNLPDGGSFKCTEAYQGYKYAGISPRQVDDLDHMPPIDWDVIFHHGKHRTTANEATPAGNSGDCHYKFLTKHGNQCFDKFPKPVPKDTIKLCVNFGPRYHCSTDPKTWLNPPTKRDQLSNEVMRRQDAAMCFFAFTTPDHGLQCVDHIPKQLPEGIVKLCVNLGYEDGKGCTTDPKDWTKHKRDAAPQEPWYIPGGSWAKACDADPQPFGWYAANAAEVGAAATRDDYVDDTESRLDADLSPDATITARDAGITPAPTRRQDSTSYNFNKIPESDRGPRWSEYSTGTSAGRISSQAPPVEKPVWRSYSAYMASQASAAAAAGITPRAVVPTRSAEDSLQSKADSIESAYQASADDVEEEYESKADALESVYELTIDVMESKYESSLSAIQTAMPAMITSAPLVSRRTIPLDNWTRPIESCKETEGGRICTLVGSWRPPPEKFPASTPAAKREAVPPGVTPMWPPHTPAPVSKRKAEEEMPLVPVPFVV